MDYSNLHYQGSSNHCYDFNQGPSRQHLFSGVAPIPVTYTEMAVYGKIMEVSMENSSKKTRLFWSRWDILWKTIYDYLCTDG